MTEYERIVDKLLGRQLLCIDHQLYWIDSCRGSNRGDNASLSRRGNPCSDPSQDHGGGNGEQSDLQVETRVHLDMEASVDPDCRERVTVRAGKINQLGALVRKARHRVLHIENLCRSGIPAGATIQPEVLWF
jgi:hypothetical protein